MAQLSNKQIEELKEAAEQEDANEAATLKDANLQEWYESEEYQKLYGK